MIFLSFSLVNTTLGSATKQYCRANGSGVIRFSTLETPSSIGDAAVPMHVARQHYLVAPGALARPKGPDLKKKKKIEAIIIKILNEKD